jgi:hypothetical protein
MVDRIKDRETAQTGHQGEEVLTFFLERETVSKIDEMKGYYEFSSREELFRNIIVRAYNEYLENREAGFDEVISELENRLGKLEDKFSKIYEPDWKERIGKRLHP